MRLEILMTCLVLVGASTAHAYQTYTYTGKTFTTANSPFTTADFMTVTFTLTSPLAANTVTDLTTAPELITSSFLISAGASSYSASDGTAPGGFWGAKVATDPSGVVIHWSFQVAPDDASAPATDFIRSCNTAASLGPGDNCGSMNVYDAIDLNPVNDGLEKADVIADPGTWTVVSGSDVPTLSPTWLAILAALLAGSGFAAFRARPSRRAAADPTH